MLRRLFSARWLGALLAAVLYGFAAYQLGHWQYGRHEYKVERNARLDAHFAAAPVPLSEVLDASALPRSRDWTHVVAVGTYREQDQLYVRNRPNNDVYGYEVLVPLDVESGGTVLVDRGWVENSPRGADVLPPVPPAPERAVTVIGWVRPGEVSRNRSMPPGQLASINIEEASAAAQTPLLGGYLVLDTELTADGATPERPQALAPPDRSLGPHQAYAFQWWLSMPVGVVLIWFGIRREVLEEDPSRRGPERPAKVRIWDEEDY